jgi:adenylate cyclase
MTDLDSSNALPLTDSHVAAKPAEIQLSPGVSYYLRRLLRQNLDRLVTINSGNSMTRSSLLGDLESLIQSANTDPLRSSVKQLERLAQEHQNLSNQGLRKRQELHAAEHSIFQLLGLSLKEESQQATILIVDDTPDNLRLLSTTLTQHGYSVRNAINGALALNSAQTIKPDLILLDIMMPGLSGYEVCERLKADPKTSDIPVIFISAIDDALDKVKAFSIGGVDYITKPFQIEEVLVRIEHQLKIWQLQKRLEEQSIRWQQEVSERQRTETHALSLFQTTVNGLYKITPDGRFLEVNDPLAKLYGYSSPAEMIHQATAQKLYVNPRQHAEFIHRIQTEDLLIKFESQVNCKDGKTLWISENARAVRNELNELMYYEGTVTDISAPKETEASMRRGRQRTRQLMLALFPKPIAQQVGQGIANETMSQVYPETTVLFAQILDLNALGRELPPAEFVSHLDRIIADFDTLAETAKVDRIKTLGNTYLAVCGAPTLNARHTAAMADFALSLQQYIDDLAPIQQHRLQVKIGLHSGSVITGIVGQKKLSYDIWGETVSQAQKLTQEGSPGKILVSQTVYESLKQHYWFDTNALTLPQDNGTPLSTYWLRGAS